MTRLAPGAFAALLVLALSATAARADVCDADRDWKPSRANDVNTCRSLWDEVGLPDYASETDATPVCHTRYVLSHNNEHKTPDWVLEQLTRDQLAGTNTRPEGKKFDYEEHVCPAARALDKDYTGSKFDRGHQAPSADFRKRADWMEESFILSNAVPQVGVGFNRGIWKNFEDLVRKLAVDRGKIYVITGPIYSEEDGPVTISKKTNACGNAITLEPPARAAICGSANKKPRTDCEAGVAVPIALYKVIYDPRMRRANAYILPNINHHGQETKQALEYLKRYRTSLRVVERYAGLQLLQAVPARQRRALLEECQPTMLH